MHHLPQYQYIVVFLIKTLFSTFNPYFYHFWPLFGQNALFDCFTQLQAIFINLSNFHHFSLNSSLSTFFTLSPLSTFSPNSSLSTLSPIHHHPSILSPILPIHLFSVHQSISLFALTRLFVSYQCYHCFRQYNDTQPSFCQLASLLLCQLSLLCWSNNWYGGRSDGGGRWQAAPI